MIHVMGGNGHTGEITLCVKGEAPTGCHSSHYHRDAEEILRVLNVIPSGTWDRVLRGMLKAEMKYRPEYVAAYESINRSLEAQENNSPAS